MPESRYFLSDTPDGAASILLVHKSPEWQAAVLHISSGAHCQKSEVIDAHPMLARKTGENVEGNRAWPPYIAGVLLIYAVHE